MKRFHWHYLRTLFAKLPAFDGDPVPDGELLERFGLGDSAAFELLVCRHAETVFGTCARICRDTHDAEDAFQATFLVLARKAKTIRRSQCLAGWLHRVAHRAATRAAMKRTKSQQRERSLATDSPAMACAGESELQAILDAEINRLTDRYRLPVLLCYLQGLSTEAAAKQLGIPRGTVLSRLATARQKLTTRLTRRGVTVPTTAVGLFGYGAGQTASASLVSLAARSITFPSTSTTAGLLAREILHMTAWKTTTAWATAFVAIAGLGGTVLAIAAGGKEGPPVVAKAPEKAPRGAAIAEESTWGEAIGGVQMRIESNKKVWATNEMPTFKLDIRLEPKIESQSTIEFQYLVQIEIDENWYECDDAKQKPRKLGGQPGIRIVLDPGKEVSVFKVVPLDWFTVPVENDRKSGLSPGKHTVRIKAFWIADEFRYPISNAVEIEVQKEPINAEVPVKAAAVPIEDEKRAELAKREKEAKAIVEFEKRDQLEHLAVIVAKLEKEALDNRKRYADILLSAGHPEYDAKVLADAISKIDAERIAAEDEKEQGKPTAATRLDRLNERRAVLSIRLLKQEAEQSDRNFRLELIKRDMARVERLGSEFRTRLEYLRLGLSPTPASATDPAIQKLIEEVAELKVEVRKLAEAKK